MTKINRIGVIVAMKSEYDLVLNLLNNKIESTIDTVNFVVGSIGDKQIVLTQCGIGKVNATMGTMLMIQKYNPDVIVSTGVAGGIDLSLRVMDIVVGTSIMYHDVWCGPGTEWGQASGFPKQFQSDKLLVEALHKFDRTVAVKYGLICSGDQFITDGDILAGIKSRFSEALAVDMETASIAQVCYRYKVPFLSMRIISDCPGAKNDNSQQYEDFWAEAPRHTFQLLSFLISEL